MANICFNLLILHTPNVEALKAKLFCPAAEASDFDPLAGGSGDVLDPELLVPRNGRGSREVWGTSGVSTHNITITNSSITVSFDSPWDPPLLWFEALIKAFPDVEGTLLYTESGNAIFGLAYGSEGSVSDITRTVIHLEDDDERVEAMQAAEEAFDDKVERASAKPLSAKKKTLWEIHAQVITLEDELMLTTSYIALPEGSSALTALLVFLWENEVQPSTLVRAERELAALNLDEAVCFNITDDTGSLSPTFFDLHVSFVTESKAQITNHTQFPKHFLAFKLNYNL